MELEGSFPCSQMPTTGPYPEPAESNLPHLTQSPYFLLNVSFLHIQIFIFSKLFNLIDLGENGKVIGPISMDLWERGWEIVDCIYLAQDRNQWWGLLNTSMNLWFS
jgi:hypothetical protein